MGVMTDTAPKFESAARPNQRKLLTGVILLLCVLIRFLPWDLVWRLDSLRLYDMDTLYHARRSFLILTSGILPKVDFFSNWPDGFPYHFPNAFDVVAAAAAWPLTYFVSHTRAIEIALAFLPVLFAPLVAWSWAALAAKIDERAYLPALLLAALAPALYNVTPFGRGDHHCMEAFLLPALFVACMSPRRGMSVVTGLLLTISFLTFPASPAFAALLGIAVFIRGGSASPFFWGALFSLLSCPAVGSTAIRYDIPSLFHPIFLIFIGSAIVLRRRRTAVHAGVLIATGALLATEILTGLTKLNQGDPHWLDTIPEAIPPLPLTHAALAFTLIMLPALYLFRKTRHSEVILVVLGAALLGTFHSVRYAYLLYGILAVAIPILLLRLPKKSRIAIVGAISLLFAAQNYSLSRDMPVPSEARMEALHFLSIETPSAGNFRDPFAIPRYGVLCDWFTGAYVTWYGRRPAVANAQGFKVRESVDLMLETDVETALTWLKHSEIKYLFFTTLSDKRLAGYEHIHRRSAENWRDTFYSKVMRGGVEEARLIFSNEDARIYELNL